MATAYPQPAAAVSVNSRTAQWMGALSCLLGVAVIGGWYAHNLALIQLRSDLTPMSFNSAVLLLVGGIALITVARRQLLWVRLLAGFGLLLSALTMSQYFTGIDLGIDQLLMNPRLESLPDYDGRTSLTGSFCFLLLNTGFLIFTLDRSSRLTRSITTVCAAIVIACVIATVIGYKTDIQPLFGWRATAFMALHTAFGIFVLGSGLLVCSLGLSRKLGEHSHLSSAAAGFIVVATATLLLWSGLSRQQDDQSQASLAADLRWLDTSILSLYHEHVNAIDRMAQRWETGKGTAHDLWAADANAYLNTLAGFRALAFVDTNGVVQWQQAKGETTLAPGTNLGLQVETAGAFRLARDRHKTSFTRPTRATGQPTFLLLRPLYIGPVFAGILAGEIRIAALLDTFQQLDSTVPFQVKSGANIVYTSSLFVRLGDEAAAAASTPLAIGDGGWSLQIKDDSSMTSNLRSYFPLIVLTSGTVMAAFIAALLGLAGLSRQNLLETRRSNAALEESRQQLNQFRTTLDRTLDCVFMIDANTLTYYYGNAGALLLLGCSEEHLLGKHPWEMNPALSETGFRERIAPLINHEADSLTFESVQQCADGSLIPVECFLQFIAVTDESPRFVAIIRDITQRKRVEQMKSEFVSTVSHELRTPLTSITGALGLVKGGALGEVSSGVLEMVDIAYKNSRRLTHLINDLLDIEKIAAGKVNFDIQVQELMPLVQQAVEGTRTYGTEHKVSLVLVEEAPSVEVRVDNQRLLQILSNLLSNAIKFSPQGSVVEIGVAVQNARVRISVRDHGRGIPEEFRGRIFQKFAQADASDSRRQSGTGLGLAISRELAERMGGNLSYDSVFGQGACFYLELPVTNAPAAATVQDACLVLHVEDDTDLFEVIRKMAGDHCTFTQAATLTAARALLQQEHFTVVIVDLGLPDGSGWDLLPEIKQYQPLARIIILTGQEKTTAHLGKVDSVLLKSKVTPEQLLAAIQAKIHDPAR